MTDSYSRGADISGWETLKDPKQMILNGPYPLDFLIFRARDGYRDDVQYTPFKKAFGSLQAQSGKLLTGTYSFLAYGPTAAAADKQMTDFWTLINAGGYIFDLPPMLDLEYEIKAVTNVTFPGFVPMTDRDLRHALRLAFGPGWGLTPGLFQTLLNNLTIQYWPIDPPSYIARADLAINTLRALSGSWPLLYGNPNLFINILKHGFPRSWLNCKLVIADWRNNPTPEVTDWDRFFLWQRAGDTPWVGIDKIDELFFPGTRNQLKDVLSGKIPVPIYNPSAPPVPPVPIPPGPDPLAELTKRVQALEDIVRFHNL